MKKLLLLGAALLLAACAGHGSRDDEDVPEMPEDLPLLAVPHVDLDRFLGRWYMIANIPYFAERGNLAPYVEYSRRDDGMLDDLYTARETFEKPPFQKHGIIEVTNLVNNAEGRITFLGPLWQDYSVLYLDDDYKYTVIAHPSRNYAWLFSREPDISKEVYSRMIAVLAANHFKVDRILKIPQRPDQLGKPGFQ